MVVTASYRTAALGFLGAGLSGLQGNYGLSDQEAVLKWVHAYIHLVGGDNQRVTVGAERQGADITSLHLISPTTPPLFQRMILMVSTPNPLSLENLGTDKLQVSNCRTEEVRKTEKLKTVCALNCVKLKNVPWVHYCACCSLQGGSIFSPSLLQTGSTSRQQALQLATELGCVTSDPTDDDKIVSCLRAAPVHQLNAAQTKVPPHLKFLRGTAQPVCPPEPA